MRFLCCFFVGLEDVGVFLPSRAQERDNLGTRWRGSPATLAGQHQTVTNTSRLQRRDTDTAMEQAPRGRDAVLAQAQCGDVSELNCHWTGQLQTVPCSAVSFSRKKMRCWRKRHRRWNGTLKYYPRVWSLSTSTDPQDERYKRQHCFQVLLSVPPAISGSRFCIESAVRMWSPMIPVPFLSWSSSSSPCSSLTNLSRWRMVLSVPSLKVLYVCMSH